MSKVNASKGGVFVQGDFCASSVKRIFMLRGYHVSPSIDAADIVVWTGGEDINPEIYNEKAVYSHGISLNRDKHDLAAVEKAHKLGKFMVGICRGAQLLNCVPNGGSLWQDVNLHGVNNHVVEDYVVKKRVMTNSVHHQMMRMAPGGILVAGCELSSKRRAEGFVETGLVKDPEVIWYPKTRSLCFQAHPEFSHGGTTEYFFELMRRYYEGKTEIDIDGTGDDTVEDYYAGLIARAVGDINSHDAGTCEVSCAEIAQRARVASVCEEASETCANLPGGKA